MTQKKANRPATQAERMQKRDQERSAEQQRQNEQSQKSQEQFREARRDEREEASKPIAQATPGQEPKKVAMKKSGDPAVDVQLTGSTDPNLTPRERRQAVEEQFQKADEEGQAAVTESIRARNAALGSGL